MPSRYSSAETEKAARTVCDELGVPLRVVSIDAAFERELEAVPRSCRWTRPRTRW